MEEGQGSLHLSCREKLEKVLNVWGGQLLTVILVLVDLLVVTALVLIIFKVIADPKTSENVLMSERVQTAESVFHIIELGFLSFFVIEISLRVVASGKSILYDKLQVFDTVLVATTFVVYLCLTIADVSRVVTYPVGYLIVARLWRFKRLYQSIVIPLQYDADLQLEDYAAKCYMLEEQLEASRLKHQNEILQLRKKLATFKAKLYPKSEAENIGSSSALQVSHLTPKETATPTKPQAVVSPHCTPEEVAQENSHSMSAPCSPTPRTQGVEEGHADLDLGSTQQLNSIDSDILVIQCRSRDKQLPDVDPGGICVSGYSGEVRSSQVQLGVHDLVQTPNDSPLSEPRRLRLGHKLLSDQQLMHNMSAYRDSCQSLPNLGDDDEPVKKRLSDKLNTGSDKALNCVTENGNPPLRDSCITGSTGTKQGISNLAFTASMTEEEFREIQRISQVPAILDAEGLPMTDL